MAMPPPEYSSSASAAAYTTSTDSKAESDASSCVSVEVTSNAAPAAAASPSASASETLINQHQFKYGEEEDEENYGQFNRIWSLTDELVILGGLAEYQEPKARMKLDAATASDFHEYIENWLSVVVPPSKLSSKIRQLKRKYQIASWEGAEFKNEHDKEVYELSKKLWGNEDGKGFEKRAGLRSAGGNGVRANAGTHS